MIDLNQYQDFLPLVSGFLGGATSAGLFTGPIQTLQDWWYVNYGHNLSDQKAYLIAKQEANVEQLKHDILQNVSTIPPENVQEPSIKVLGPAIEASRYYIEEKELRDMFAKLIASSLDDRKNNELHSSFVEIIKQLDVLDAKIVKHLSQMNYHPASPIPAMKMIVKSDGSYKVIFPLIYFIEPYQSINDCAPSLYNLERLGIIQIENGVYAADETLYTEIKNNTLVQHTLKNHPEITLEKMSFSITPFGKNFISICA